MACIILNDSKSKKTAKKVKKKKLTALHRLAELEQRVWILERADKPLPPPSGFPFDERAHEAFAALRRDNT